MIRIHLYIAATIILVSSSCSKIQNKKVFELVDGSQTGITFANNVPYTEDFNTYTYRNFYNGGGVALGDINNDGLTDVYLTGNMTSSKLYLNKGDWRFEDITEKAGVGCKGVWSTGVTMVDINHDGLLDIYVCKAGKPGGANRHNELFINNGDQTFVEKSADYNLNLTGLSIHSSFFDYDRDGDLDCYILKNSLRSVGGFDLSEGQRNIPDPDGNQLLRNDNGKFVDVSESAGIYSSKIGYGLGITVSDFNLDQYPDIFISNDFFEKDYMYLNNKNGSFSEVSDSCFMSMSMGSMGADASDLDNDLLPDIIVTEMLPSDHERKRTKNQYESWDKYETSVKKGYHHQFSRNALHKNLGNGDFLEIGRLAGVADTDWSWSALAQDYNNDGWKDIYITNGLYKDLLDKDYLAYTSNTAAIQSKIASKQKFLTPLIDSMPSIPVSNVMFTHDGDFMFDRVTNDWGMDHPGYSNGSAYGDLDNDGDLDFVVNNVNMPAFVYRNLSDTAVNRSIKIRLRDTASSNYYAIGAKVIASLDNGRNVMLENFNSRGFQSSVDLDMIIGMGQSTKVDTLTILWPNGSVTYHYDLKANGVYKFDPNDGIFGINMIPPTRAIRPSIIEQGVPFLHQDVDQNLFASERLMNEMSGFDGPAIAVGDVNGDSQDDVFYGGSKFQLSQLHISHGDTYKILTLPFEKTKGSEVTKAIFFDADGDKDLDIYVGHGGKTFSEYSSELTDVIYINDGKMGFELLRLPFDKPICTGDVAIGDINRDGRLDIIIAEQMKPSLFGQKCSIYQAINQGKGRFDIKAIPSTFESGMYSAIELCDINGDKNLDIIAGGKWSPIITLMNQRGSFLSSPIEALPETKGLWNTLHATDIDNDGDMDIIAGNQGLNSASKVNHWMYVNDFDSNGTSEQLFCQEIDGKHYPIHDLDELYSHMPILKKRYRTFKELASADMSDLFPKEIIKTSLRLNLEELRTIILINENGKLRKEGLPLEVQFSSVYAIYTEKNQDNHRIVIGGNSHKIKPQYGRLDASMGWEFFSIKHEKNITFTRPIPLFIKGQIRNIQRFDDRLLIGVNNSRIISIK
jgi:enediyne biosynthesis protein E4